MTQPTAEAYEVAERAYESASGGTRPGFFSAGRPLGPSVPALRAAVDAVWPLAVVEGRQLGVLPASLVETAKAWRKQIKDGVGPIRLSAYVVRLIAAVDALTRGKTL